jgi:hypothetical protein
MLFNYSNWRGKNQSASRFFLVTSANLFVDWIGESGKRAANENLFSSERIFQNGNENPFVCQRNSILIFIISAGN